jgi:hypothetical protein
VVFKPLCTPSSWLIAHSTAQQNQKVDVTESIRITCSACYILGKATAQLTMSGNFNATQAFHQTINKTMSGFEHIESAAINYLKTTLETMSKSGIVDLAHFSPPTMGNITFNLDVQSIPQALLQLQFDGLELYFQLDTMLDISASYKVNLFTPQTPLALAVPGMDIGVWFTLDLLLDADANIDMTSGFHIKLVDGVQINIPMFAPEAADMKL